MFDEPTSPPLIPLTMRASVETFSQDTQGWPLATPGDRPEQARSFRTRIHFATPFTGVPVVQVALTGFDIDKHHTARIEVRTESITPDGFDLLIGTWQDTRVYQVSVGWLALGH